jgi:hypothetical protein
LFGLWFRSLSSWSLGSFASELVYSEGEHHGRSTCCSKRAHFMADREQRETDSKSALATFPSSTLVLSGPLG